MRTHPLIAVTVAILVGGGLIQPQDTTAQQDDGMRVTSSEIGRKENSELSRAENAGVLARLSLQSACAAFDLHILIIMDEASAAQPASIRLVEATQILLRARAACREGDTIEALRLYSTIDLPRPTRALQPILGLH